MKDRKRNVVNWDPCSGLALRGTVMSVTVKDHIGTVAVHHFRKA